MKKYLVTGSILLLPLLITLMIIIYIINALTDPFIGIVRTTLISLQIVKIESTFLLLFLSKTLILVFLFSVVVSIGFLGHKFFKLFLINLSDAIFSRIPLVNAVYKASREFVHTILTPDNPILKNTAIVPCPHQQALAIGIISLDKLPEGSSPIIKDHTAILVLGGPNPIGFLYLYPKDLVEHIDMKSEDALKCVVSCGVIFSPFTSQQAKLK